MSHLRLLTLIQFSCQYCATEILSECKQGLLIQHILSLLGHYLSAGLLYITLLFTVINIGVLDFSVFIISSFRHYHMLCLVVMAH